MYMKKMFRKANRLKIKEQITTTNAHKDSQGDECFFSMLYLHNFVFCLINR
jgi:hypothetical protein